MAYDYRNKKPPEFGDGRYNFLPVDCARICYYDMFGKSTEDIKRQDLSFQKENLGLYSSDELNITGSRFWNKKFGDSIVKKNGMFAVFAEKDELHNSDNFIEMQFNNDILRTYDPEELLTYVDNCMTMIANRDYNLILIYQNYIRFIHLPYERETSQQIHRINPLLDYDKSFISKKFVSRFLHNFESNNQNYCMAFIDKDIINNLDTQDLDFVMSVLEYSNSDIFHNEQDAKERWKLKKHLVKTRGL